MRVASSCPAASWYSSPIAASTPDASGPCTVNPSHAIAGVRATTASSSDDCAPRGSAMRFASARIASSRRMFASLVAITIVTSRPSNVRATVSTRMRGLVAAIRSR